MAVTGENKSHSSVYIILHQIGFLLTGLCTTLGVQWLFYRGAATSMSLLPQLSSYTGMLLVGFFIPMLLNRKRQMALTQYKFIETADNEEGDHLETTDSISSVISIKSEQTIVDCNEDEEICKSVYVNVEEGPIDHFAIIKLASLDIIASFALTIGFSIIGSGMYQVIYSSVVVFSAILTWLFMGRALTAIQWMAIIGTSVGLGVSSLDSFSPQPQFSMDSIDNDAATINNHVLLKGTLMTLAGTIISACIYVYADNILSKNKIQPLPARVCTWMGVYTSIFTWIWITVYTLPQFNEIIHIDQQTTATQVLFVYFIVTIANALHSWSYYELIELTGNVATGILQGLRAIVVYAISHLWYCSEDQAQCFTTSKGCGSMIVISCVLLFTLGKKKYV